MTTNIQEFTELSDRDLLAAVHHLARDERRATASLIASLAELDERRLYLAEGYSSLFTYCTQVLRLSEHATYGRIEAARVARKYPVFLERLEAGHLTLTTIGLLAPHLTSENYQRLIDAASRKSKRDVEHLVATLRPQPVVPSIVRELPQPRSEPAPQAVQISLANQALTPPSTVVSPAPAIAPRQAAPALVKPLAAERYRVQCTVTHETFEKLRRVQDLMRHTCPNGDVGIVFERALTLLLQHLEETKLAQVSRPQRPRGTTLGLTTYPVSGATNCLAARQWAVRVHRCPGTMYGARLPRVSSRCAICGWRNGRGRQHPVAMPRPQPIRVVPIVRPAGATGRA